MRCAFRLTVLAAMFVFGGIFSFDSASRANELHNAGYSEINLSYPQNTQAIPIAISQELSEKYHWMPGQRIRISLSTETEGDVLHPVADDQDHLAWELTLDGNREGRLFVLPDIKTRTGKLVAKIEGKDRDEPLLLEKIFEYRFSDGVRIKVHFTDQILEESGETVYFARDVLDAAVQAYQTITQFEGFSTVGYAFAFPDPSYAHDPDRTIDIYLGSSAGDPDSLYHGFKNAAFKDAPCFDTLKLSETQYQAIILLPSNYKEFIKNWERINPSSLGTRNVNVDLLGTLMHEMSHVILFYYNKNLNKDAGPKEPFSAVSADGYPSKKVDWYVEGLARYFETFAGARHDFFSQGFKQTLPDKIRFSRGGSNYFMRYPDQAFTDLRYENALFWRYIDYRYGMGAIERLSRDFRDYPNHRVETALERATRTPFKELLKTFAMAILLKDFGLKEDAAYLKDIAKTHLVFKKDGFYLIDGDDAEQALGKVCRTDWIGRWENASAKFGKSPVAGDNTDTSDVSGWATDYFEIDLDSVNPSLPGLRIAHEEGGLPLAAQILLVTKGGSQLTKDLGDIPCSASRFIHLREWVGHEGLSAKDIAKIYLLISNTDPQTSARYEITATA